MAKNIAVPVRVAKNISAKNVCEIFDGNMKNLTSLIFFVSIRT